MWFFFQELIPITFQPCALLQPTICPVLTTTRNPMRRLRRRSLQLKVGYRSGMLVVLCWALSQWNFRERPSKQRITSVWERVPKRFPRGIEGWRRLQELGELYRQGLEMMTWASVDLLGWDSRCWIVWELIWERINGFCWCFCWESDLLWIEAVFSLGCVRDDSVHVIMIIFAFNSILFRFRTDRGLVVVGSTQLEKSL